MIAVPQFLRSSKVQPLAAVIERRRKDPESWRYTDIEKLMKAAEPANGAAQVSTITAPLGARLTFINGVYAPEQSRLNDLPSYIITGNPHDDYRLELEGQTCLVTQPIELLFVTRGAAPAEITTRLHITVGESGRLSILERHQGNVSTHMLETVIELQKQAKLVHGKIVHDGAHIALSKVSVAEGAYYDNFALTHGVRLMRNEIEARLTGNLAQCALNGLMLLSGHEHADTATRIIHEAPFGVSRQLYKTVATGKSQGVFQGKVIVDKGADKTDAQQLSRALLLSDQAEVDAKPELEINADDVKCSHGSTAGNLDADAMFYLRARGLSENEARALLIRAFAAETLDQIHIPEWRDAFQSELEDWCDEQD
jgi:Fe-S cluster assembly protein SufD